MGGSSCGMRLQHATMALDCHSWRRWKKAERVVQKEEGAALAEELKMLFFEASWDFHGGTV